MKHRDEILNQYMRSLSFEYHDNNDVKAYHEQNFEHIKNYFSKFANQKGHSIAKSQAIKMIELISIG